MRLISVDRPRGMDGIAHFSAVSERNERGEHNTDF